MSPDFKDLLAEFNAHRVDFLVVGAHALAAHGHVRATKDLDVWVRPTRDNARNVLAALLSFGAALHGLSEDDLSTPGVIFQMGVAPVRIDVITAIDGVIFDQAWADRMVADFAGVPAAVLSRAHPMQNKAAAGRPQDLIDLAWLRANP